MKIRRNLFVLFVFVVVLAVLGVCLIFNRQKQTSPDRADTMLNGYTLAIVNGVPIKKERFDSYKEGLSEAAGTFTDKEILDRFIDRELMLQDAAQYGISVTDEEVNAWNEQNFSLMEEDPAGKEVILAYLAQKGYTLDEYKKMSLEISRISLIGQKYRDYLRQIYNETPENKLFDDYYAAHMKKLREDADIVVNEKLFGTSKQ